MRAPLSWLRDFAPFEGDVDDLAAALDDLGLVVEGVERVGRGPRAGGGGPGARGRAPSTGPTASAGWWWTPAADPLEIVCGAFNFGVGDLVPLAPVGAVLPGGFEIGRRKMQGVVSNGMLCSGQELGLSDDGQGLLVLTGAGGRRARACRWPRRWASSPTWSSTSPSRGTGPTPGRMAGVARDLAARLGSAVRPARPGACPRRAVPTSGPWPRVVVEDAELCPRFTARVLTGVRVGPSPPWLARRLILAGMRPINNVVDASNYVMLELGQPTHPYDLDRLGGPGCWCVGPGRRAPVDPRRGDRELGSGRGLGRPGGLPHLRRRGPPVGIGGIMGGASSEISATTTRVLLEAAYFAPMAIARTSKRLGLRTEASARFERGGDPWGIDRAPARFCELVALTQPGPTSPRAPSTSGARCPVRSGSSSRSCGSTRCSAPTSTPRGRRAARAHRLRCRGRRGGPGRLGVGHRARPTGPTCGRPPTGVADVIEEVARTYGYARLPRRQPAWPEPGRLTQYQRERRTLREVLVGSGALEAWTPTFLDHLDHVRIGLRARTCEVANPLVADEASLRRSQLPGLLRALAYNVDRRQGGQRLFEVGTVFSHPGRGRCRRTERAACSRASCLASAATVTTPPPRWPSGRGGRGAPPGLGLAGRGAGSGSRRRAPRPACTPPARPGWSGPRARCSARWARSTRRWRPTSGSRAGRVGWLEVDLGLLLDPASAPRVPEDAQPVSRFPSSDVDLALVVDDAVPADRVAEVLAGPGATASSR